jgi:hypothetical protein
MGCNKVERNVWQTLKGIIWLLLCRYISNTKGLQDRLPKAANKRLAVISLFFGAVVMKLALRIFDKFLCHFQGMRQLTPLDEMFLTDSNYGQVCIMMRFEKFDFKTMSDYILKAWLKSVPTANVRLV